MPVEAALSRTLAGRALAQAGQPERAVTELRRAAEDLHACGALRYRAAAEFELRRLGQHIHRRTKPGNPHGSGIESLTSRELQIARLVVDRKTNPEIAETLFLSPKTVETHMRTLFHKLDVSSRVEVARAIERSGISEARVNVRGSRLDGAGERIGVWVRSRTTSPASANRPAQHSSDCERGPLRSCPKPKRAGATAWRLSAIAAAL